MTRVASAPNGGEERGDIVDEKRMWTGIAPSPRIFDVLDQEEATALALLAWSVASNRPVTMADLAALPDRDGNPLGPVEARQIVERLSELRIISVRGAHTPRPLSVFLGGFQPRRRPDRFSPGGPSAREGLPHRPEAPSLRGPRGSTRPPLPSFRPPTPGARSIDRTGHRIEDALKTTPHTPAFVLTETQKLRARQEAVERKRLPGTLVDLAEERLSILRGRIRLYERWLREEPTHPRLREFLDKKRRAVPELEFQVERARAKQAEGGGEDAA